MSELFISATILIRNISNAFSGQYQSNNEEYITIRREIFDLDIPTIEDDRKNTRSDMANVGNDLKKSVKEYGEKSQAY